MAGHVIQGFFPNGQMAPSFGGRNGIVQMRPTSGAARGPQPRDSVAIDPARLGLVRGGGQPLPLPLLEKMQSAFQADFSTVRVHIGPQAERLGAIAFTTGNDVYFAPGRYQPDSIHGQELIGHELTHVIQQRQGRVRMPMSGVSVLQDAALEAEADRLGAQAARHMHANVANAAPISHAERHALTPDLVSGAHRVAVGGAASVQLRGGSGSVFVIQRKTAISFNPADDKAGSVKIAAVSHQRELHNSTQRTLAAYLSGYNQPPSGLICNHHVPYSYIRSEIERILTSKTDLETAVQWMNGLALPQAKVFDWNNWGWNLTSNNTFTVGAMPKPNIKPTKTVGLTKYYAEATLNTEVNDLIWNLANDPRNLFYWPNSTGDGGGTQVDTPTGTGPMGITHIKTRLNDYVVKLRGLGINV
ncbi:eCIS core domain-containing protein [Trinickia acidisoli]|uniref:eCIS core domain-containing protein n=1 Tax=Trinickia acidisoli TaxID=2767482 RepID=UPI001A8E24E8|nr:DUF4157 domain-containing protein [Trinickia acidisoli]